MMNWIYSPSTCYPWVDWLSRISYSTSENRGWIGYNKAKRQRSDMIEHFNKSPKERGSFFGNNK